MARFLSACLLGILVSGTAAAAAMANEPLRPPFDFSTLDLRPEAPAQGFYAMRVNELARLPLIGDLFNAVGAALANPTFQINISFDFKAEEIEQIVGGIWARITPGSAPGDGKGTMMCGCDCRLIRLTRDIDWKQQILKNFSNVKEHAYKGRAYYETDMPPVLRVVICKLAEDARLFFFPADARTLVIANADEIHRCIDEGDSRAKARLADFRHDSTVLVVIPDVNGRLLKEFGPLFLNNSPWSDALSQKIRGTVETIRSASLAIDLQEECAVKFDVNCRTAREAADLLPLVREGCEQLRAHLQPLTSEKSPDKAALACDILARVAAALSLSTQGDVLSVQTQGKVPFLVELRKLAEAYPPEMIRSAIVPAPALQPTLQAPHGH